MSTTPWFAFYPGDYLSHTQSLTLAENGAYFRLLMHYYSMAEALPDSQAQLWRISGAVTDEEKAAVDRVISLYFTLENKKFHNKRADKELAKQAAIADSLSKRGKRGAKARWNSRSNATANATANAQAMPSTTTKYLTTLDSCPVAFANFWNCYPRKKNKAHALRAWNKLKPENGRIELIMSALESAKHSDDWTKSNGQFIPYPATWLNAAGWLDETGATEQQRFAI